MHSGVDRQARAVTAAGICGAAAALNFIEAAMPSGPRLDITPGIGACCLMALLLLLGPRLPATVLASFGPAGATLVAIAVATTPTYGDGAVLYMWPAVWTAYFYGPRATSFVVGWTALVHALALVSLPAGMASFDRWLDVTAAVAVVAGVVQWIAGRNQRLVLRLAAQARSDDLTGLLNRRGFDERLEIETIRAARYGRELAAICFDIDRFKAVNDTHGHEMGDRVLACFGSILASEVRAADIAARTGGEEFTVLLPETTQAEAAAFAERVRQTVEGRAGGSGCGVVQDLGWTVSGGVASANTLEQLGTLLGDADRALYDAKASGRNQVSVSVRRGGTSPALAHSADGQSRR